MSEYQMCSNCKGNNWLIKVIPDRSDYKTRRATAYPCPFCNSKRPHRQPMDISIEELKRMRENESF